MSVKSRENLQRIAAKLALYVPKSYNSGKAASRLAEEILSNPIEVVSRLCKIDLYLLDELVKAGPNAYAQKKICKTEYMLQKLCLVLTTYGDEANGKWQLLMPDEVREALAPLYSQYLEMATSGQKGLTAKQLRIHAMMSDLLGHSNVTIIGNTVHIHKEENSNLPTLD